MELYELSITEASKKLSTGEITSVELCRAVEARARELNPGLNAYLEIFDDIEAQAQAADARRKAGENRPLLGIPLAIKDNILIEGKRASAASRMLENYVATYDATVIKKLKEAGAVFIGRANMDEFAMGGSTENSAFGATKNPFDETRVPGGSSGGSAAAVAAHLCLGALGTDTGGSIREPASFCGLVGLKPTYGAVSRSGLIAMGSSLDQAGPLTRSVEDAEIIFDAIRGEDIFDSTSVGAEELLEASVGLGLAARSARAEEAPRRIGVPRHLLTSGVDADILALFEKQLEALKQKGYEIIEIELPSAPLALASYYVIMPAEVSSNLARFDGVRYGLSQKGASLAGDYAATRANLGPEARRRIVLGTYVLSSGYYDAYYGKATAAREALRREFAAALEKTDAIAMPTTPAPAPRLGEKSDPLSMYLMDVFTVSANMTGNPSLSTPMGTVERDGKQLPAGLQLTAAHGDEAALFRIGKELAL